MLFTALVAGRSEPMMSKQSTGGWFIGSEEPALENKKGTPFFRKPRNHVLPICIPLSLLESCSGLTSATLRTMGHSRNQVSLHGFLL